MKIEITNCFTKDGREYFEWDLYDGPNGIEHAHGYGSDLAQTFTKIFEWRERIGADYAREVLEDMETLQNFLQKNGNDCNETSP